MIKLAKLLFVLFVHCVFYNVVFLPEQNLSDEEEEQYIKISGQLVLEEAGHPPLNKSCLTQPSK